MTNQNAIIRINSSNTEKGQSRLREHGNVWKIIYSDTHSNKPSLLAEAVHTNYLRWWSIDEIKYETLVESA
jgi:hypothetical protein